MLKWWRNQRVVRESECTCLNSSNAMHIRNAWAAQHIYQSYRVKVWIVWTMNDATWAVQGSGNTARRPVSWLRWLRFKFADGEEAWEALNHSTRVLRLSLFAAHRTCRRALAGDQVLLVVAGSQTFVVRSIALFRSSGQCPRGCRSYSYKDTEYSTNTLFIWVV